MEAQRPTESSASTSVTNSDTEKFEWSLTPAQMLFMLQRHNDIEVAFEENDMEALRNLAQSPEFVQLFGDMGFDEAFDRYEAAIEHGSAEA